MKLLKPVTPIIVIQKFGAKSSMYQTYHTGVDIGIKKTNGNVKAVYDGIVTYVNTGSPWYTDGKKNSNYGKGNPYGTHVKIKHEIDNTNVFSLYGHLNSLNVAVGQHVKAGDIIGKGGSTGFSTGPHLHLEIRKGLDASNKTVDPIPLLFDEIRSESELKAIAEAEQNLKTDMDEAWKVLEKANKSRAALAQLKGVPYKQYSIISE